MITNFLFAGRCSLFRSWAGFLLVVTICANGAWAAQAKEAAKTRKFRFTYGGAVTDLKPGKKARVWLPVARSTDDQSVKVASIKLPSSHERTKEKKFGNELLYFEAVADQDGRIPYEVVYEVVRRDLSTENGEAVDDVEAKKFLAADKLVPVGGVVSKKLLGAKRPAGDTLSVAHALYNLVDDHMKYDKSGEGWGRGDAVWACDSRFGNCTDFHSVFISLARDLEIPAKFEIGFPLPPAKGRGEIGGYHCWAKFANGQRWVGVDISEADKHPDQKEFLFGNLPSDRVMFTVGRDLELAPKTATGPVNFLVYPHVEVDGKLHTKFEKGFKYEDS